MIKESYLNVLQKIHSKLYGMNINWVITGSTAFTLQGIPLEPNDIDIQTDKEGAYQIEECFKEFVTSKVSFSTNGKVLSYFGCLEINSIRIEIMGDLQKNIGGIWERPVDLKKYKNYIFLNGMYLPVLDLEYEYNAYMQMGRVEKATQLRKYIDQKSVNEINK